MHHDIFIEQLRQKRRRKFKYPEFLAIFAKVFPEFKDDPGLHARVSAHLHLMEQQGIVALPKNKNLWNKHTRPHTPFWVQVLKAADAISNERPEIFWVPELGFAAGVTNPVQRQNLCAINDFIIHQRNFSVFVPIKERSLQIFADEKKLDRMLKRGGFFGGKLSLEQLKCYVVPTPIAYELLQGSVEKSAGLDVLVVENASTYHSFCSCLKNQGIFGAIAYGGGKLFCDLTNSVKALSQTISAPAIYYFGDLDPEGVSIASKAAAKLNGCNFRLCYTLYGALLQSGVRAPLLTPTAKNINKHLAMLFDGQMAACVQELFESGQRMAQEHIGTQWLKDNKEYLRQQILKS